MKRETRTRADSGLKPVRKIELSEKHIALKIVLFVLFLALGITAIILGVYFALRIDKGWKRIEVSTSAQINCGSDFVFNYNLGQGSVSATDENKILSDAYTQAAITAYRIFDCDNAYEGMGNVFTVNAHVNEEVEVDAVLYNAFQTLGDDRSIYLAPVYAQYSNVFYSNNDFEANSSLPEPALLNTLCGYANDEDAVKVELLGDNKVKLIVSDEYLAYADENKIYTFIDFNWLKNAFIIDYFADLFSEKGYTRGYFTSYDGFVRNLDKGATDYGYNIVGYKDTARIAAVMKYSGAQSFVFLRSFPLYSRDYGWYYKFSNGNTVAPYIDVDDGQSKAAASTLVCYKQEASCAEMLMKIISVYVADELDVSALNELKSDGVYSVYIEECEINYNQPDLELSGVYDFGNIKYTTKQF